MMDRCGGGGWGQLGTQVKAFAEAPRETYPPDSPPSWTPLRDTDGPAVSCKAAG